MSSRKTDKISFVLHSLLFLSLGGAINFYINDKLDKNDPKKTSDGKAFGIGVGYTAAILIVSPILYPGLLKFVSK